MHRICALATICLPVLTSLAACTEKKLDEQSLRIAYGAALPGTKTPLQVFHLGHSLVGQGMPLMLAQLAGAGHGFHSQLGWGTTLEAHWEIDVPINGFETSNAHDAYRDFREAITSGDYDAFVLTEMVEIKDAIRYHDSAAYLARIADYIRRESPASRIYLYESWHDYHGEDAWLKRLDQDYERHWLSQIVDTAMAKAEMPGPIYVIPVGQVMLALFTALQRHGAVPGLAGPEAIFGVQADGSLDKIHLNDLGNYLVATVHYAVLYRRNPVGLTWAVNNEHGEPARGLTPEAACLIQRITWEVVSNNFRTGVAKAAPAPESLGGCQDIPTTGSPNEF